MGNFLSSRLINDLGKNESIWIRCDLFIENYSCIFNIIVMDRSVILLVLLVLLVVVLYETEVDASCTSHGKRNLSPPNNISTNTLKSTKSAEL